MANDDGGAANLVEDKSWDTQQRAKPQSNGKWTLDAVSDIPAEMMERIIGVGGDFSLATFGFALGGGIYNFPGLGPRFVLVLEKYACVYRPENVDPHGKPTPSIVEGIHLDVVASVRAAILHTS